MAKIKWLGDAGGAEETTGFGGLAMKKGEWLDCDDPNILKRAAKNKYFEVEGYAEGDPTVDVSKDVTIKPPSQQTAQYPVPKHGDVTTLEATVPNPPDPVDPDPPPESPAKTQGFAPIPPVKK